MTCLGHADRGSRADRGCAVDVAIRERRLVASSGTGPSPGSGGFPVLAGPRTGCIRIAWASPVEIQSPDLLSEPCIQLSRESVSLLGSQVLGQGAGLGNPR